MEHLEQFLLDAKKIWYLPELNEVTGGVLQTIIVTRVAYWYKRMKGEPFYKFFTAPTKYNPAYKVGQSWSEEMGMTKKQLSYNFPKTGQKLSKGDKKIHDTFFWYWTDSNRLTWFLLNTEYTNKKIGEVFSKRETKPTFDRPIYSDKERAKSQKVTMQKPKLQNVTYLSDNLELSQVTKGHLYNNNENTMYNNKLISDFSFSEIDTNTQEKPPTPTKNIVTPKDESIHVKALRIRNEFMEALKTDPVTRNKLQDYAKKLNYQAGPKRAIAILDKVIDYCINGDNDIQIESYAKDGRLLVSLYKQFLKSETEKLIERNENHPEGQIPPDRPLRQMPSTKPPLAKPISPISTINKAAAKL